MEELLKNLPDYGKPYMAYDLETTSKKPEEAKIVQIGVVIIRNGDVTGQKRSLINPGVPIPAEATEIHGITDEDVKEAPPFSSIAGKLEKTIKGSILLGYNSDSYDDRILARELRDCGIWIDLDTHPKIDALRLWHLAEPRTLEKAYEKATGQELKSHDAGNDAMAAAFVAGYFIADAPGKAEDLIQWQWPKEPGWLDRRGYAVLKDGVACVNFGKHAGKPIKSLDNGYLNWLSQQDFPADFMQIVEKEVS
ncbi:MAG: exonuclease domain-containing protein [bacterium]